MKKAILSVVILTHLILGCGPSSTADNGSAIAIYTKKKDLRSQVRELMKLPDAKYQKSDFEYTEKETFDTYNRYRLEYLSNGEKVPSYLLIPKKLSPPYPVMICLQGHAPGMFISMGDYRNEREKKLVQGGRDLALQAIENGWAALVIEQKGFGERQKDSLTCNHQSLQELLKGKSMLGQRVHDISSAIDMIQAQDSLKHDQIGIIGNSSGGTTAYYAAAMDERIDLAVVSCSFSTLETSWLKYPHCACGYLPGLLEVADMPELTALIAPRNLILVAGEKDYLADIDGVRQGYESAKGFYQKHDAADNLRLVVGDGGHQFYPEQTWPVIQKMKSELK